MIRPVSDVVIAETRHCRIAYFGSIVKMNPIVPREVKLDYCAYEPGGFNMGPGSVDHAFVFGVFSLRAPRGDALKAVAAEHAAFNRGQRGFRRPRPPSAAL